MSGVHAEITWSQRAGWQVKDRGSRNGTFVEQERLKPGESRPLYPGCRLAFGTLSICYRLVDASLPRLMATSESGTVRVADEEGLLSLPSSESCLVTVFLGEQDQWMVEAAATVGPAEDQQWVVAGDEAWRLSLPTNAAHTREATKAATPCLADLELGFQVSRDGEHVELLLRGDGVEVPLPERTSHFLLLALARARRIDGQGDLPESEHGWSYRDELGKALGVDPDLFNLWVYRCRRQFAGLGLRGAAGIIESRPMTRQVRIGLSRLRISEA